VCLHTYVVITLTPLCIAVAFRCGHRTSFMSKRNYVGFKNVSRLAQWETSNLFREHQISHMKLKQKCHSASELPKELARTCWKDGTLTNTQDDTGIQTKRQAWYRSSKNKMEKSTASSRLFAQLSYQVTQKTFSLITVSKLFGCMAKVYLKDFYAVVNNMRCAQKCRNAL
jgi:hypothetical protein